MKYKNRYIQKTGLQLLLLFSCFSSIAQLNESDTVRLRFRGSMTGNYQQGNVELFALRTKADLVIAPAKGLVFKTQNNSLYQSFYSVRADNDLYSRNYLYYQPTRTVYPFAIVYASGNYRRKIKSRVFAGAGITTQVLRGKNLVVKVSGSLVRERSLFRDSSYNDTRYNGRKVISCWRGTLYSGGWYTVPGKKIRVFYDAFFQPAISLRNNYRSQADIGLDMPVWRGLSFTMLYSFTHENTVIQKIKKQDKILSFGLSYSFSKNRQL